MKDLIRKGYISAYNAEFGTASVYYPDRNHDVTADIPIFTPCGLAQKLEKDDQVLVLHLSNGTEAGMIIGESNCEGDTPKASIYVDSDNLTMKDPAGIFTLGQIIALKAQVDTLEAEVSFLQAQVDALS